MNNNNQRYKIKNNQKNNLKQADEEGENLEEYYTWEDSNWNAGKDLMEEDWEHFIQESQPIQPTENENTYEKWWIYRGKNHSCSCGQLIITVINTVKSAIKLQIIYLRI